MNPDIIPGKSRLLLLDCAASAKEDSFSFSTSADGSSAAVSAGGSFEASGVDSSATRSAEPRKSNRGCRLLSRGCSWTWSLSVWGCGKGSVALRFLAGAALVFGAEVLDL